MGRVGRNDLDQSAASESDTALGAAASAVAIIDRSRLRRECLKLALAQHNPHWHVAEFATADELLRIVAASEQFDLVLIGAATAEHVDLGQLERMREMLPETPVVVVAENGNPQRARAILGTGARGFLPASLSLKVLMGALDLVLAGGVYVPSSLLISQGKSNKLIADALTMSESTVKAHVKQIIKRLHVSNRTQAALLATGHGFYPPAIGLARNGNGLVHGMAHELIAK